MIYQWAIRWGVPFEAVQDLQFQMGIISTEPSDVKTGTSESAIQNNVRLEAAGVGCRLWRNNVGAMQDESGRWVRFGLCNDSAQMNKRIKSSDLVGIRPVNIGGAVIGQFIAREVKSADWVYTGTDREKAQLRFINLINSFGGDARFCTGEGSL